MAVVVCAGVGFLPGVDSDVVGEQPGAGEGLLADVALVVPVVGLHVHGQGGHARVELVANCATSSLLSVDLPVSGQVAARGKLLPTVLAGLRLLASLLSAKVHLQAVAGVLRAVRHRGCG